ncbi:potassium channel family protein [Streptomyces sp. NBC_00377]|uniref:potassium channel family protein n=1 Tax=unclassified Streptomyces TaxID=2593676 RepID=UPI002E248C21|nr:MULTISPECIES: potassium channel family protein [unclassified Streptomyces]
MSHDSRSITNFRGLAQLLPQLVLGLVGGIAVVALLLSWQVRKISRSQRPGLRAMEALGTTLPIYLLLFATTYRLIEHNASDRFSEPLSRSDALYFTVTVFSTVGFGDISPRSEPGLLVTEQMTANLLLVGVAARYVVAAVGQARTQQQAAGEDRTKGRRTRGDGRLGTDGTRRRLSGLRLRLGHLVSPRRSAQFLLRGRDGGVVGTKETWKRGARSWGLRVETYRPHMLPLCHPWLGAVTDPSDPLGAPTGLAGGRCGVWS